MRTKILLSLGIIFFMFIVVTELTVSKIVQVSLASQFTSETQPDASNVDVQKVVKKIRRPVLLYLSMGVLISLIFASIAISRIAVKPLDKIKRSIENFASGTRDTEVPLSGSSEIVNLGKSLNSMISTINKQQDDLNEKIIQLKKSGLMLEQAQDELIRSARLASVGTLASGVAHEIGNPITGVLGLLDALKDETDVNTRDSYLEIIKKETQRIDKTIQELLVYARPSSEDGDSSVNIDTVLSHVRKLMGAQKMFKEITLVLPDNAALNVKISEQSLSALVVNLLLNSAQAINGKGQITVSVGNSDSYASLSIEDDGPGIDAAIKDKIFEPFYSSRHSGKGTGLGLSICQNICDRAAGTIELDTGKTNGTKFIIKIPIVDV